MNVLFFLLRTDLHSDAADDSSQFQPSMGLTLIVAFSVFLNYCVKSKSAAGESSAWNLFKFLENSGSNLNMAGSFFVMLERSLILGVGVDFLAI